MFALRCEIKVQWVKTKNISPLDISIKALKKKPTPLYSLRVSDDLNFQGSYYKMKF